MNQYNVGFAVTYKTGFFQVPENLPSALQVRISCFYVFFFLFWSRASEGKGYVPFEVYLKSKGAVPLPRWGEGGSDTPLYGLYRDLTPVRVWSITSLSQKQAITGFARVCLNRANNFVRVCPNYKQT